MMKKFLNQLKTVLIKRPLVAVVIASLLGYNPILVGAATTSRSSLSISAYVMPSCSIQSGATDALTQVHCSIPTRYVMTTPQQTQLIKNLGLMASNDTMDPDVFIFF